MTSTPTAEGVPLPPGVSLRLQRVDEGWLADDPDVECYAAGSDPNEAVEALIELEKEYLNLLRAETSRSALTDRHFQLLTERLGSGVSPRLCRLHQGSRRHDRPDPGEGIR